MPRRTTALTYNVAGQLLELLVRAGRPTSATFAVYRQYDTTESTAEFTGAATVDTPNTTTSAAAGPTQADPHRIPLTSTAGIVAKRRYLLAQNALQEWIDVVEVGVGYVRAVQQVQNAYTAGATFQSSTLFAAVDAAFIANLNKLSDLVDTAPDYFVKWTVLVGGVTVVLHTFFDVVRTQVLHAVELADVDAAVPGLMMTIPTQYRSDAGRSLIDRAWSTVRADFIRLGLDINAVREEEVIDEITIRSCLRNLAEGGWAPPGMDKAEYLRTARDNYDRFYEGHFAVSLKHPVIEQGSMYGAARARPDAAWEK